MKIGRLPWRPVLELAGALIFISFLLNFDYPARHLFSWKLLLPSADVWLLLVVLALAALCGRRALFWTSLALWGLFIFLRLFRIGDTAVPLYLNRDFNLYIDSAYLYDLYDLLKTSAQQGDFLWLSAKALTVGLAAIASTGYAWRTRRPCWMPWSPGAPIPSRP